MKGCRTPLQKSKKAPERTCIACLATKPKKTLVRLVRTAAGRVEIDSTGRKPGRGAYLCPVQNCWEIGLRKNKLGYALHLKLAPEDAAELTRFSSKLFSLAETEGKGAE